MSDMRETFRGIVLPGQCDHFGHLNVRYYAHFFDDGAFHLWSLFGYSLRDMRAQGFILWSLTPLPITSVN